MSLIPTISKCQYVPRILSHLKRRTVPCLTCVKKSRSRNQRRCQKCHNRSIRPYFVKRSSTLWLHGFRSLSWSTFRSTRTTGYHTLNHFSISLTSDRCSSVETSRYAQTSGIRVGPVTILQITTFGLWKRVDSTSYPSGRSLVSRPIPPWYPLALDGPAFEHAKLYPSQLWKYASVWIFVVFRSITSTPPKFHRPDGLRQSKVPAIPDV